jgi:diguanylate cyclase (GGDEF)-like protein/PAS domain S-box-containing protein
MNNDGLFPIVKVIKGPWYWINIGYTYTLMVVGLIVFIIAYSEASLIIRKQLIIIMIAWVIPWFSDIIYTLRLIPFNLDLCPFGFSFSGIISSFAIFKFKLLKITPIALEKVFSNMSEGVIILDSENNIVNFNNASKNIISELEDMNVGYIKIDDILKEYETVLKAINSNSGNENLVSIKNRDELRYYKMNINNIYENTGEIIGKTIILNDITEIKLQQKKVSDNLNFLKTLMEAIPYPIYSKDENGRYNHCNVALTEFLGIKKEEFVGNNAKSVFEKKLAKIYDKTDKNLIEGKGTQACESKLKHNDGTYHDVIFNRSVVLNEEGNNKGLVGVIIDITEQKKNEEKMNKLLKLKEVMLKIGYSINEVANINDLLQVILYDVINCVDEKSSGSILLLDQDNNLKIAVAKGYSQADIREFSIKLEEHFAWFNGGSSIDKTVIFNNIDKMKTINMLETSQGIKIKSAISSPIIIDGELYGFLNIDSAHNDIFNEGDIELMEYMRNQVSVAISKHKLNEQFLFLSRYDKLTNVYNRSYFEQLIYADIYNDNADEKEFFAAIFDLNQLKFVNDNYGHSAGDELIRTFSKGLISLVGESDIIGRYGGDEFVGVFFNVNSQSLINKFEELSEHFKNNPIIFEGNKMVCSYSYGIANFPSEEFEFDKLLKIADKRMYEYKSKVKRI